MIELILSVGLAFIMLRPSNNIGLSLQPEDFTFAGIFADNSEGLDHEPQRLPGGPQLVFPQSFCRLDSLMLAAFIMLHWLR